jgi:hypothetical protein
MKFIITIDTEGDNQWDHGRELTVENIKFVPRFQELCDNHNIKPTYFVTSEVCEDSYARKIFTKYLSEDKAEIGTHLHSWSTPPFLDEDGFRFNDPIHAFATEFPEKILREKIKNITSQIEESFGRRPLSFRSGRFGFNDALAMILIENSYLVDSSVTPFTNWSDSQGMPGGNGGPDFSDRNAFPYYYKAVTGSLLEIPVTVLPTKFPLNRYRDLAESYFRHVDKNLFFRVFRKMYFHNQPLWLRPHRLMNLSLLTELLIEAKKLELPYIVMMFHSSELMPGCSIYRPDEDSIESLYDLLGSFFDLLDKENIASLTLTEAAKIHKL